MKTIETTINDHGNEARQQWIAARKERLTNLLEGCFTELEELIAKGIQTYRVSQDNGLGGDPGWEAAREEWMRFYWPEWVRCQRRVAVADAIRRV